MPPRLRGRRRTLAMPDREAPICPKRKGAGKPAPLHCCRSNRSALRELEAPAGLGLAVLLAPDGAAVAGQEAFGLDRAAQRRLIFGECLGDAVLDRAGLAREAAALDGGDHVILTFALG